MKHASDSRQTLVDWSRGGRRARELAVQGHARSGWGTGFFLFIYVRTCSCTFSSFPRTCFMMHHEAGIRRPKRARDGPPRRARQAIACIDTHRCRCIGAGVQSVCKRCKCRCTGAKAEVEVRTRSGCKCQSAGAEVQVQVSKCSGASKGVQCRCRCRCASAGVQVHRCKGAGEGVQLQECKYTGAAVHLHAWTVLSGHVAF